MPLPDLNSAGDLPLGIHQATLDEMLARFGVGSRRRQEVAARLYRIWNLARATGRLDRFIVFGSFITDKLEPNDVDIVLVMRDDFDITACDEETRTIFDHRRAASEMGASIFWIRPGMLLLESADEFVSHWQLKRDGTRRGIAEVIL